MHVQYQLHPLGRERITRGDVVGVVSFLNNASDDYHAAVCDFEQGIIDVAYRNGTSLQPEHSKIIGHFCYELIQLTEEEFSKKMKSRR